jgi:hypothetical protein
MTDKPVSSRQDPAAPADGKAVPDAAAQQPKKQGNPSKTILWGRRAGPFGRNPVPRD